MTVTTLSVDNELINIDRQQMLLPDHFHEVMEYSILASPLDPFDPMEKAMQELAGRTLSDTEHIHKDWTLTKEYPLSEKLLAMSHVWKSPEGSDFVIAAKGAPEAIADLCHLDGSQIEALKDQINHMTRDGLRVLGVAKSHFSSTNFPAEQHDFNFDFIGLLGLSDPVRPEIAKAVEECYTAGIRIIMITGDYPGTAKNIAAEIGLKPLDQIITGSELDVMSDQELAERIKTVCIFARAVPEQKLRIVQALKANGEVVAMTGDGVDDAPALKAAHIGIAMGGRGTDVARESAALVLLDDNFASIVKAVRMGRRIYDNLKKAIVFIFSVHIPIAGMSLIPVLFKLPLALMPVHILFLELIIDPACTLIFEMESEEADIMKRPPRKLDEALFGRQMVLTGFIQGLGVLAAVLVVYLFIIDRGFGEFEARMMGFVTLVISNLGLIFTNRSWSRWIIATLRVPNSALWWVTGGAATFLTAIVTIPYLQGLFKFAPLHKWEMLVIVVASGVSILISESVKTPFMRKLIHGE